MSFQKHGKVSIPGQRHNGGVCWTDSSDGGMSLLHKSSWLPLSPV
jgi:hypothetical protein